MADSKVCAVDGCGNPHKARGYCASHYNVLRRTGDPLTPSGRVPVRSGLRWLNRHKGFDEDRCLPWPFGVYPHGYGRTVFRGVETTASRVMCILAHGEPPAPEFDSAHSCGNRPCCNPRHLRWATKAENQADRIADGTDGVGEMNGAAKLSAEDVSEIRRLRGVIEQKVLGARFGITKSNVSAIQLRKSWAWLD